MEIKIAQTWKPLLFGGRSCNAACTFPSLNILILDFPGGSVGEESACNAGDPGLIPGGEDPLEKEVATHSGILAWEIPWTEEPGGLQSMGSQELDMTEQLNRNHHHHPLPTGKH